MESFTIKFIPHEEQAYRTLGNYRKDAEGNWLVEVSDTGDRDYNVLVALHELIELHLVNKRGIPIEAIEAFDMEHESRRTAGETDEPGDHPEAPYRREHSIATAVERLLCEILGRSWSEYEAAANAVWLRKKEPVGPIHLARELTPAGTEIKK